MIILERFFSSIRLKVMLVVIAIVIGITCASLFPSLWIGGRRFTETIESDMSVSSAIAAALVSQELKYLKRDAEHAAMKIMAVRDEEMHKAAGQVAQEHGFNSVFIIEARGMVHTLGNAIFSSSAFDNEYARRAFRGETVISTTEKDINQDLVMRIWVPMEKDRIMCAVLPGMILSERISQFRIWKTGNIFVVDDESIVIANYRPDLVQIRSEYFRAESNDPSFKGIYEMGHNMRQGVDGIGYYHFEGVERLCAYTPIEGSDGWVLGVVAPMSESPLAEVQSMLLLAHSIFLLLGILAAFFTAKSIAAPFHQIEDQNRRLEELMRSAESASEAKSSFLANMSHEMRTPLNAIIGFAELELGSEELAGSTFNNMEKIYDSGMILLGIINDILDISKIESGKFELAPVVYDLPSLINDTINLNVVRIGSKPIEFRLHIEETMPAKLFGDELRVKQIFNNLLSNAFKYTPKGTVDWYISGERAETFYWLSVRVEDTGIGIKESDISKLFTDYNRMDAKSHRTTEGTGLGLSITKRLVDLMDGSIEVQSEFGKGSVFSVRIKQPLVDDVQIGLDTAKNLVNFQYTVERRSRRHEKLIRAYMPYATVLVVDDVSTNLDVARGMLKPYGMTVECVNSGQGAINLVREEKVRYNAIFMDHMMPEMDGIEAVEIIRNQIDTEYARTVPIIALTANAIVGNDEMFLKRGFQAFLSKPIDVMRLNAVVNRWVRNKQQEKGLKKSLTAVETPSPHFLLDKTVPGMDLVRGLRRFEDNEESYLQVIQSYVAHTLVLLESIREVKADSLDTYRVNVHGIKGSSYAICADVVGKRAADLEQAASTGDVGYIKARNEDFISLVEGLVGNLKKLLSQLTPRDEKSEKSEPDPELLAEVLRACDDYDIEKLEEALTALNKYRYTSGAELVNWLLEQGAKSEFGKIMKRLTEKST